MILTLIICSTIMTLFFDFYSNPDAAIGVVEAVID